MARLIITPINEDGTVGRAIVVNSKSKAEKVAGSIGVVLVWTIYLAIAAFIINSFIQAY